MSRARACLFVAVAGLPLVTVACGGSSQSVTCTDGTMIANEANDYSFTSSLMLHPVTVMPMSDLAFDWGGVTQDFLGHPVNAATDLNTIFLLLVSQPAATFEMQLNNDTFLASSVVIPGPPPSFLPTDGVTMTTLYNNFQSGDGPVTPDDGALYLDAVTYTPSNSTYLLGAQTGTDMVGSGIRMLQSFELDPSSTNTTVNLTNSSTTLTYTADLHSLHPTGVPAATAALTLDWSQLSTNGLGETLSEDGSPGTAPRTNIASAIVGHYSQTPAQLESQFLDLQTIAEDLYTAVIPSGTVLDFTHLRDKSGNSFPGVGSTGTWLVALMCPGCRNPAPYYLTILDPVAQPCATK